MSGSNEDRFLNDILFGMQCLLYRNLSGENILAFIDQPGGSPLISTYSFPPQIEIFPTTDLYQQLSSRNPEKLVFIVTGHGGSLGISASPDIQPCKLLDIVKGLPRLKASLIVLGQCFAGTFNYLEARVTNADGKVIAPELCLIGATDLASSLSVSVDISGIPIINQLLCPQQWIANFFLLYFMQQVADPIDYDGDGFFTALDAFKAAGIGTNAELLGLRQRGIKDLYQTVWSSTVADLSQQPLAQKLAEKARQDFMSASAAFLTNQSPWILNANDARKLEL